MEPCKYPVKTTEWPFFDSTADPYWEYPPDKPNGATVGKPALMLSKNAANIPTYGYPYHCISSLHKLVSKSEPG